MNFCWHKWQYGPKEPVFIPGRYGPGYIVHPRRTTLQFRDCAKCGKTQIRNSPSWVWANYRGEHQTTGNAS